MAKKRKKKRKKKHTLFFAQVLLSPLITISYFDVKWSINEANFQLERKSDEKKIIGDNAFIVVYFFFKVETASEKEEVDRCWPGDPETLDPTPQIQRSSIFASWVCQRVGVISVDGHRRKLVHRSLQD